jgi:hypothetical protein
MQDALEKIARRYEGAKLRTSSQAVWSLFEPSCCTDFLDISDDRKNA